MLEMDPAEIGNKQSYSPLYIHLDIDSDTQTVKDFYCQKDLAKAEEANNKLGVYFLRTNLKGPAEALE